MGKRNVSARLAEVDVHMQMFGRSKGALSIYFRRIDVHITFNKYMFRDSDDDVVASLGLQTDHALHLQRRHHECTARY